jgi:hypothetical protein
MAGYLATYGAGEESRSKLIRRAIFGTLGAFVAAIVLFFGFRNFTARGTMDSFIELLRKQDFKSAHALWGCTDQTPCKNYDFERFMRDWGPESPAKNAASARIEKKATCGGIFSNTGVMRVYRFDPDYTVNLWYDKSTDTLGFAPVIGKMQCTILP